MTTHPTDAEIVEIGSELWTAGGWQEGIDRLCAAARDRNQLEAEMGSLSIVAGIRGDLCVAERKRCEKLEAENAKLREAYRKEVILTAWTAGNYGAKPHHYICEACGGEWAPHDAEKHAPACLAALPQLDTDNG